MSIYTINSETELAGGSVADADELVIYDADAAVTKKVAMDSIRQFVGGGLVTILASDALTAAEHAGRTTVFGVLTGATLTLPAATGTGDIYKIGVALTVTSNDYIVQVANATDEFLGTLLQTDVDTTDTLASYPCLDGDGFDTITMNGTTKGGLLGDSIVLTDIATGMWQISGHINGNGTVATPFSAGV